MKRSSGLSPDGQAVARQARPICRKGGTRRSPGARSHSIIPDTTDNHSGARPRSCAPAGHPASCRSPRIRRPMFNWLRRRRLSAEGRKKLMLFSARAEEETIDTHVANLLDLLDTLGDELDLDGAIDIYVNRMMNLDESLASTVTTRLLAQMENSRVSRGKKG